jgi:alcohol dehydrogenase YqhD (iron-dependent ADH family)
MKDFTFYAPTRVVFGREAEEKLPQLIQQYGGGRVLVHFGGGSARRSGLLDKVEKMLTEAGIAFVELGGVVPNPLLSKVREGIELCRREHVNFILAVGGGSVIDSAKAIGYGVGYPGDVWDFWDGKAVPRECLPIGVMLTIPAAGSEMSSSCVVTNDEGMLKRGVNSDLCRCRFAIMNPKRTFTLPAYQTAAGATDIMMHTMERYFSKYEDARLTDALAEALLRTVIESTPVVLAEPENYEYRAAIMWASSLSHNDLMECGTEKDFACHKLEHELSGLFGVTHGAGLAAIWGSWARYVMDRHLARFVKFATNVMGIAVPAADAALLAADAEAQRAVAQRGVEALERFFTSIGMPVSIPALIGRQATDAEIAEMVAKCSRGGKMSIGSMEVLGPDDMQAIYRAANE